MKFSFYIHSAVKQDEVPAKKIKDEPKDKQEIKKESENEKLMKEQNKLFYKYRCVLYVLKLNYEND